MLWGALQGAPISRVVLKPGQAFYCSPKQEWRRLRLLCCCRKGRYDSYECLGSTAEDGLEDGQGGCCCDDGALCGSGKTRGSLNRNDAMSRQASAGKNSVPKGCY